MSTDAHERQTAALYRLFQEAAAGGQAKVDALLALTQRTVFVVPWPAGVEGFRTLVNSTGTAALPVFTEREQPEQAARRYGWLSADGSAPAVEIGARQALHYARVQGLAFVVVDIAADHCLEIAQEEFEPLLSPAARRESSGPFSGAGRVTSSLMRAVRKGSSTPPPGALESPIQPPPSTASEALTGARKSSTSNAKPSALTSQSSKTSQTSQASTALKENVTASRVGAPRPRALSSQQIDTPPTVRGTLVAGARLSALPHEPDEALLENLEALLRAFPEIEWACLGNHPPQGIVLGLRVDPRMRTRVEEIAGRVATLAQPSTLAVVLLDEPAQIRAARTEALVFYPWRRR